MKNGPKNSRKPAADRNLGLFDQDVPNFESWDALVEYCKNN